MKTWLHLWFLKYRRNRLQDRCEWLRENIEVGIVMLNQAEAQLCDVQVELCLAQTPAGGLGLRERGAKVIGRIVRGN